MINHSYSIRDRHTRLSLFFMYYCEYMQNTLALIRIKVGHKKVKSFIEKDLGIKYRTFVYQCENGVVTYKTIKKLLKLLDIKFEDLKEYEFIEERDKKKERKEKKIDKEITQLKIPTPMKLSDLLKT